jgi:CBS domain-containing protein
MSLKWYRMPQMVALKSSTPVLEAARAIENNNIGAVVVQDNGCVVGIVTDRDLAVRVLGRGLDARMTPLVNSRASALLPQAI